MKKAALSAAVVLMVLFGAKIYRAHHSAPAPTLYNTLSAAPTETPNPVPGILTIAPLFETTFAAERGTGIATSPPPPVRNAAATTQPAAARLARPQLIITSIGLTARIERLGLTPDGKMGVLNDSSATRVGLFGAEPGARGSAVMDAHVYQTFKNLHKVRLGDEILVENKSGEIIRFRVKDRQIYAYTDPAPLPRIFNANDGAYLNLITCYGQLLGDRSTYTHRLVVFAERMQ